MNIKEFIIRKGFTSYSLAKATRLSKSTIGDIYSGKADLFLVDSRTLYIIARTLGTNIETLLKLQDVNSSLLPNYLIESIDNYRKELLKNSTYVVDYYSEVMSTINVAEVNKDIDSETGNYLRKKYLGY
ncbi:MAG: helix-turn-helix transcriptional regulator [Bacilli bacterium]|jgi:transcriptional regulator with XRE-family HTH domain